MGKEPKERIHLKDIQDGKENREEAVFIVGDNKYWADRTTKDKLATHADCEDCGTEFEKEYSHSRRCHDCDYKKDQAAYLSLPLVQWDGTSMLADFNSDERYFSDPQEAIEYCADNEIEIAAMWLVVCTETKFDEINVSEIQMDNVHEDWEPDAELEKLEEKLNDYLKKASTKTWFPSDKRINLEDYK